MIKIVTNLDCINTIMDMVLWDAVKNGVPFIFQLPNKSL